MSLILIVSIFFRLAAAGWSLVLTRRMRDWRLGFLAAMILLMGIRQTLTLLTASEFQAISDPKQLAELPELAVSTMVFLAVFFLGRLLIEQKQAENDLRESHNLLHSVVEGTSDAVFVKDMRGRYVMINSAGGRLLGKSVEEVIGKDDTALFSPDTAVQIMEGDRRIVASGEAQTYEETSTAGGITRTYLATKHPWRNPDGRLTGLIGIARDITQRKQAEESLRASEEIRRSITESSPDYIIMVDREGKILFINKTAPELTVEQVIGTPIYDYMPKEDAQVMADCFAQVLETGKTGRYEIKYKNPDGEVFLFGGRVGPVIRDGEIIALTVNSSDITTYKRAEEEIRKLNEELEQRVAERTSKLRKLVKAMAGREVRMAELKDVIRRLRDQLLEAGLTPAADDPLFVETERGAMEKRLPDNPA